MSFVVESGTEPVRVDRLVAHALKDSYTRNAIVTLFRRGLVTVDARPVRKGTMVRHGQRIVVELALPTELAPASAIPLDIRVEHPRYLVVCKPAFLATTAVQMSDRRTLANAIVARIPELRCVGFRATEPGLVHRLDVETSGLVLVARDQEAFVTLSSALSAGDIDKRYLAVCTDRELPDSGYIDFPLCPHPKGGRRVMACRSERDAARYRARPSRTRFAVLDRARGLALVEVSAGPAYRHQVRVHLAAMGCPLVGDKLYGGADLLSRHALHAHHIAWAGSELLGAFAVTDALPCEMAALLGR